MDGEEGYYKGAGHGEGDPRTQEKRPQPVTRKREGEGGSWLLSPNAQLSLKASAASLSLASPLWLATGLPSP